MINNIAEYFIESNSWTNLRWQAITTTICRKVMNIFSGNHWTYDHASRYWKNAVFLDNHATILSTYVWWRCKVIQKKESSQQTVFILYLEFFFSVIAKVNKYFKSINQTIFATGYKDFCKISSSPYGNLKLKWSVPREWMSSGCLIDHDI